MQDDFSASLKRFIKRVPNSGAAPSYKLTLPHQIVRSHLLHLVDADFELASSPHAVNTWQGSIVPRRNKDRSEYTLQGWRLWAEAHHIQSGDQVSFELVTPRKLVLSIIRPEAVQMSESPSRVRKFTESLTPLEISYPSKSLKAMTPFASIPSSSNLAMEAERVERVYSPPLPEMQPLFFDNALGNDALELDWTLSDNGVKELNGVPSKIDETDQLENTYSTVKSDDPDMTPQSPSVGLLPVAQTPLSQAFVPMTSILTSPSTHAEYCSPARQENLLHPMLSELPVDDATPSSTTQYPGNNAFGRCNSGTLAALNEVSEMEVDPTHNVPLSPWIQTTSAEARNAMKLGIREFQIRLDKESRAALKAAMGLEKCAIALSTGVQPAVGRDSCESLFKHLSTLKLTLWQMLVLAMAEDQAQFMPANQTDYQANASEST